MKINFTLLLFLVIFALDSKAQSDHHSDIAHQLFEELTNSDDINHQSNIEELQHALLSNVNSKNIPSNSSSNIKLRLENIHFQEWDTDLSDWVNSSSTDYIFDDENIISEVFRQEWDTDLSDWVDDAFTEYFYEDQLLKTSIRYNFDENGEKVVSSKYEYEYNDNGNEIKNSYFRVDEYTQEFVITFETIRTYDDNNNQIMSDFYLDNQGTGLNLSSQFLRFYNEDNLLIKSEFHSLPFGMFTGELELRTLDYYFYDDENRISLIEEYDWDPDNMLEVPDENIEYVYATNGDLEKYTVTNTASDPNFVNIERTYTYDEQYSFEDLILPFRPSRLFYNHKRDESLNKISDAYTNELVNDSRSLFNYVEVNTTSISTINSIDFISYPNPVKDFVSFDILESHSTISLEIYDVHGRNVLSKIVNHQQAVDLSGLSSGMYFYQLNIDDSIQKGKLIKE